MYSLCIAHTNTTNYNNQSKQKEREKRFHFYGSQFLQFFFCYRIWNDCKSFSIDDNGRAEMKKKKSYERCNWELRIVRESKTVVAQEIVP